AAAGPAGVQYYEKWFPHGYLRRRTLTGRGADFIIVDDPLKPDEAVSDTQRKAVNEWFTHSLYSRLNDKRHGCIIVIMQRLHEDDLVGHVLGLEPWKVI